MSFPGLAGNPGSWKIIMKKMMIRIVEIYILIWFPDELDTPDKPGYDRVLKQKPVCGTELNEVSEENNRKILVRLQLPDKQRLSDLIL
jgi:hypothetical protein